MQFTVEHNLRPCYVDGKKALFHRWAQQDNAIIKLNVNSPHAKSKVETIIETYNNKHVIPAFCELEKVTKTVAIIEYASGGVAEVEPIRVVFADNKIKEYAF